MSRNLTALLRNPRILVTVIVTGVFWGTVQAQLLAPGQPEQLDVGHTVPGIVKQGGEGVGLAWAQGTDDPCIYTEFWYLTPKYVYPGSDSDPRIRTVLRLMENTPIIDSPKDFFRFARSFLGTGKRIKMKVREREFCGADGFN